MNVRANSTLKLRTEKSNIDVTFVKNQNILDIFKIILHYLLIDYDAEILIDAIRIAEKNNLKGKKK